MRGIAALMLAATLAGPALAANEVDALTACFADNTTGKDRRDLARWVFISMAAHPAMHDIANVSPEAREEAERAAGQLYTRLLTESCAPQALAAIRSGDREALGRSVEFLGKLAMQELATNKDVAAGFAGVQRYIDRKKLESAFPAR